MWRYRPLMPLAEDAAVPPLLVGNTPLYEAPRLAADLGLSQCGSRMMAGTRPAPSKTGPAR